MGFVAIALIVTAVLFLIAILAIIGSHYLKSDGLLDAGVSTLQVGQGSLAILMLYGLGYLGYKIGCAIFRACKKCFTKSVVKTNVVAAPSKAVNGRGTDERPLPGDADVVVSAFPSDHGNTKSHGVAV